MSSVPPKEDWVRRLKSPDSTQRDAALEELRELLVRGLSRSLNAHYANCGFQAEDIVQQALLKILDSLETFEGRSRFTTWALTIATRVGISALRRKHCKDVSLEQIAGDANLRMDLAVDDRTSANWTMDQQTVLQKLQELIESLLTERQRFAIRGLLEGLPVEEVAARTGSNRNAVYKLVHDARAKLREGFERDGIVAEDISAIFA